jgi:2-methylcitrate dehydratase PrpD
MVDRTLLINQLAKLGEFVPACTVDSVDGATREALARVVADNFTVTIAGSDLTESVLLRQACQEVMHGATAIGSMAQYSLADAAWLNGVAMVSLELDEGNKAIRGHASAHVFAIALALAETLDVPGNTFLNAFLAGHEVASRFGNAVILHDGIHPHGNWGVTGAAAASAHLLRLSAQQTARAIDNATTQALATPFEAAIDGMSIRNSWIGVANVLGYRAAIMASTESDTGIKGAAARVFGETLGSLDTSNLNQGLGDSFFVSTGYFKRHASCSYTHPPADAALRLREQLGSTDPNQITDILVETHHLATPLTALEWPSRMAAMFSIPYVVATALRDGDCKPERFEASARDQQDRRTLATKVRIKLDPSLDKRLPKERAARLTLKLNDGRQLQTVISNPIGDVDHAPFGEVELRRKSEDLIGLERATRLEANLADLATAPSMRLWMTEMRSIAHRQPYPNLKED